VVSIARDEDEPYVTGDESIDNRRDGLALEISIEDRKIEVGFPRRFQRLVDARGLGGDGKAELTQHVREHRADHHVVFDDEDLGLLRGVRFGCQPSPLRLEPACIQVGDQSDKTLRVA